MTVKENRLVFKPAIAKLAPYTNSSNDRFILGARLAEDASNHLFPQGRGSALVVVRAPNKG